MKRLFPAVLLIIIAVAIIVGVYDFSIKNSQQIEAVSQVSFVQVTGDDTKIIVPANDFAIVLLDQGNYLTALPVETGCFRLFKFIKPQNNVNGFAERTGKVCQ
jgi:hypothetical protein